MQQYAVSITQSASSFVYRSLAHRFLFHKLVIFPGPDSVILKRACAFFLQIYTNSVYRAMASVAWQFWEVYRLYYVCVDKKGSCICLVSLLVLADKTIKAHQAWLEIISFLKPPLFAPLSPSPPASHSLSILSLQDEYIKCPVWDWIIAG